MSTPTHVIIPPTPVATATNFPDRSEHTRSASEGQIPLPGLELTASPPPTTPTTEDDDDPLSRHWRESPRTPPRPNPGSGPPCPVVSGVIV